MHICTLYVIFCGVVNWCIIKSAVSLYEIMHAMQPFLLSCIMTTCGKNDWREVWFYIFILLYDTVYSLSKCSDFWKKCTFTPLFSYIQMDFAFLPLMSENSSLTVHKVYVYYCTFFLTNGLSIPSITLQRIVHYWCMKCTFNVFLFSLQIYLPFVQSLSEDCPFMCSMYKIY